MSIEFWWSLIVGGLLVLGCGAPQPPGGTGGTKVPPGTCGRGIIVVASDYQSTNVSLIDIDGNILSSSLISSASATTMLSEPLSGDVVASTMPAQDGRIALIDRYPAGVLTWVDVRSGAVAGQLRAATTFSSNPQDYAEISPHKGYVTRLDPNVSPGTEPFGGGSDILVIDPQGPAVLGRIDLQSAIAGEDSNLYPRPNRILLANGHAVVLLSAYSLDFTKSASSRIVTIDTAKDMIVGTTVLVGMHGCLGLAKSPSGERISVSCTGTFQGDSTSKLDEAGVVVLARKGEGFVEESRWPAVKLGLGAPGFSLDFASEGSVVLTTFGREASGPVAAIDDTFITINLASSQIVRLLQSAPFTLGEVRCAPACGACFVTDAKTQGGVVHRFEVNADVLEHDMLIRTDTAIGLPPRSLGLF